MKAIRIFLSSPGDCKAERTSVHEIAEALNADPVVASFAHVEIVAWDWRSGVPLEAHRSPQTSVNAFLPMPEACEIFVGIFRCKFGTPLPENEYRKTDGSAFLSGSEYEFHRAWDARRRGAPYPHLLVYRLDDAETGACPDALQFQRMQAFFTGPPFKESGAWTGSLNRFINTQDFKEKLDYHLRHIISQWRPGTRLSLDEWMKRQARRLTHDAGPRYTADAHVETEIGTVFDWLLARTQAVQQFDKALADAWKRMPQEPAFNDLKTRMVAIAAALRGNPRWEVPPDFDAIAATLENIETLAWKLHEQAEHVHEDGKETEANRYRRNDLLQLALNSRDAVRLIGESAPYTQKRLLLLTGPAGQGKTHTLVHEINQVLEEGGIAVGVLGHTLSASGDLWRAILQRLDYQGSLTEFLDELENAAASRGQRALLVFDALNETPDKGRWKSQLAGMIGEVLARPHLALALGVRSDYLNFVLPPTKDDKTTWVKFQHPGFTGIGADALLAYCAHYGVKAPVAPPIGELGNPLYVQLLVKSLQGRRELTHWLPSWQEVWEAWIARMEDEAQGKLGLDDPSRPQPIRRVLSKLARAMLDDGRFDLPRLQANDIAKATVGVEGVIGYLCSAGALMDRVVEEDEELIEFGFERLSDTFLVDRLLTHLFKGLAKPEDKYQALTQALAPGGNLYPLSTRDYQEHPLSYHRSGMLAALCLAAPRHIGAEIPTLIPATTADDQGWQTADWALQEAFVDSLRWRNRPEEFGTTPEKLWALWQETGARHGETELDELICFALIPDHPFAMDRLLHPWLLAMSSPGERDAAWSVVLVPLWFDESSTLQILVRWAKEAALDGVHADIALPAARLMAWTTASSQRGMRLDATRGLTRLLAACPEIVPTFLPDFLDVNDAYVLESVLTAVLGLILGGEAPDIMGQAARLVYVSQFPAGNARWCHLTIRHYARSIVEEANARGWLPEADLDVVRPPYRSRLSLEEIPNKDALREMDRSSGFGQITGSCFGHDFYWYVMGATSGRKHFSSTPLPGSSEPVRSYAGGNGLGEGKQPDIFDIPLAARFVAWNCKQLGWTAERFDEFDKGFYTRDGGRFSADDRTERIGKKYQWIGWQTMLGFLTDNYEMTPEWGDAPRRYDNPHQIGYIEMHDPSRWLHTVTPLVNLAKGDRFWEIPSQPPWPVPELARIEAWAASPGHDLPPDDIINTIPDLPVTWGDGPWLRLAAEHIWNYRFAPGQWGLGHEFQADIWWQIWPMLVRTEDMPRLLDELGSKPIQERLAGIGRLDADEDRDSALVDWPERMEIFDRGFGMDSDSRMDAWLPAPWMPMVGACGHPDRRDEHRPVLLPWPRLFREWGLTLDLRRGVVLHGSEVVFGLAGWVFGKEALFARIEPLRALLDASGYSMLWWMRGERRAFLNIHYPNDSDAVWVDYHGLAYLGPDGRVNTAWLERVQRLPRNQ